MVLDIQQQIKKHEFQQDLQQAFEDGYCLAETSCGYIQIKQVKEHHHIISKII